MILADFIKKNYSFSLELIKNSTSNKKKRKIVTELIQNLLKASISSFLLENYLNV